MKYKRYGSMILLIIVVCLVSIWKNDDCQEVITVGVYQASPYYEIDDSGKVSGYYHDLLKLVQKKHHMHTKYVVTSFSDAMERMKEGEIDLVFGVSITSDRLKDYCYTRESIATEEFSIYANQKKHMLLSHIRSVRVGVVRGTVSADWVLQYFASVGIEAQPVYVGDWIDLEAMLDRNEVDLISTNRTNERPGYYKIYEFSGDQVYIASKKGNEHLIESLDEAIHSLKEDRLVPLQKLHDAYFGSGEDMRLEKDGIWIVIVVFLSIQFLCFILIPHLRRVQVQSEIRIRMYNGRYLLQYQPIYNPRNHMIVGFEGLLRLLGEDNRLIPPIQFLPEIEENHMLYEISLWILNEAIRDYREIAELSCMEGNEFYISINVSLNEIENKKFVAEASKRLKESGLGDNRICLEIVERIKLNDLKKVSKNVALLKRAGFKIAMDDFGTEYSNLDLLMNLDTNIIKVDKCFVEGLGKDVVKNEVIQFISRVAQVKKKDVVLEGVELASEADEIKRMEKDRIFVQGYYYNKPLYKDEIERMCQKKEQ